MTAKVMISLPDDLATRMKASIPSRERSKVISKLLENEIQHREDALYRSALAMEQNEELKDEMAAWDNEFFNDGLDNV